MKKKYGYIEPVDYFPVEIRKKFKLGEFAEDPDAIEEAPEKSKTSIDASEEHDSDNLTGK